MRIESSFNRFAELLITPLEQQLYSQIYGLYVVYIRNLFWLEVFSYVACFILFYGIIPWHIYVISMLISLFVSWVEIHYCNQNLKRQQRFYQRTARNIIFINHTLIWIVRIAMFGVVILMNMMRGHIDFTVIIALFFFLSSATMSTSVYFYRSSSILIFLFMVLITGSLLWVGDPKFYWHISLLIGSTCVLAFFSIAQRKKLFRTILHSSRSNAIAQDYERGLYELNQFYRQQSRYLSAASHDLRQPLHALALVINGAYRQTQKPEALSLLLRMEGAIEQLTDAFNVMLLLSRFDSEKIAPVITLTPLQPIFDQLNLIFKASAQSKGIVLHIQNTHLWTHTDASLLLGVLKNMLHYLIEFDGTQKILVGVRRKGNGAHMQLYCRNAHRLYEPFNAHIDFDKQETLSLYIALAKRFCRILQHDFLPASAKNHVKCLSIELKQIYTPHSQLCAHSVSIADGITPPLDANYAMQSQSDSSTIFKALHRPVLNSLAQSAPPIAATVGSVLEDKKVIVIDDDPIIVDAIEQLLSDWGMEVSIALSLEMAQEIIVEEGHIDLVISDYHLGNHEETGLDIIQALRETCHPFGTYFVLISGDTTTDLSDIALNYIDLLVYKPIRPARLRVQLAELMTPT